MRQPGPGRRRVRLRILKGSYADVYLNRAVLRGYAVRSGTAHVSEPTQLTPEEAVGFFDEVLLAGRATEQCLRLAKMNYELVPHLHAHVIPRHRDDPAPGAQLPSVLLQGRSAHDHQFDIDTLSLRESLSWFPEPCRSMSRAGERGLTPEAGGQSSSAGNSRHRDCNRVPGL